MRSHREINLASQTSTVIWCPCERCGAQAPRISIRRHEGLSGVGYVRYRITVCCGFQRESWPSRDEVSLPRNEGLP